MNKRIANLAASLVALMLLALTTGCASSSALQKLEAENKLLQKRVAQMQKRVYAAQRTPQTTAPQQPGPMLGQPMPHQAMVNPALVRQMSGTPQNWAYLNRPSEMCEGTPLHFQFENWSGQYLALMLDGQPLQIIGESTILPHMPPGTTIQSGTCQFNCWMTSNMMVF